MKRSFQFNSLAEDEIHKKVALVERNPQPFGHKLVNVSSTFRELATELAILTKEVEKADTFAHAAAVNRLEVIAEQMKFLQAQACRVVVELHQGLSLNHVACNFKKIPGKIYHLYQRPSGQKYFSMISPEEWSTVPHEFLGSFRLEMDMSWTPAEKIEVKEKSLKVINNILNADVLSRKELSEFVLIDSQSERIDSQSEKMIVDSQS